ncbi:lysostaphin resistance A-like protein [Candidatus Lokiarchaeum ossiferum]|uniref:lysostaphin resistance A-like protein n=1 Tax=Candidatus Lokiarchaeum ossiferum TaxID=2951803 RepID=UPI00352EA608
MVYEKGWLNFVDNNTDGLINQTFIVYLVLILIILVIFVVIVARNSWKSIGIQKGKLLKGFLFYFLFWCGLNLIFLIACLIFNVQPIWYPMWLYDGQTILSAFGLLIAQIFGNVFFEEIFFRGYILSQLTKKISSKNDKKPIKSLVLGALSTSIIFALIHIPNRIIQGFSFIDIIINIPFLILIGLLFCIVYIVSNNLFISMGVHIIWNIGFTLINPVLNQIVVISILLLLFGIIWYIYKIKLEQLEKKDVEMSNPSREI